MAQIPTYEREFNFTGHSEDYPATPHRGDKIDNELDAVALSLAATKTALGQIRRTDGQLKNLSVGLDQLKPEIVLGTPTDWTTATEYEMKDVVWRSSVLYVCNTDHTSGTFATDLAAGKWTAYLDYADPLGDALDYANAARDYRDTAGAHAASTASNLSLAVAAREAAEAAQLAAEAAAASIELPLDVSQGGTGAITKTAGFDNLTALGTALPSAATVDLTAASITSPFVTITGTTTITSFGSAAAGVIRFLRFTGALQITYNVTSMILPGAANITTAAGDFAIMESLGSGNWRMLVHEPYSATALGRALASISGTAGYGHVPTYSGAAWVSEPLDTYNAIINGDFEIAQRGTSFTSTTTPANSDDTYLLDRWTLLSDGNDIVDVTQETTTVPTGKRTAIALDVETANKKFGVIQFIEQCDAVKLIGGNVTLSFQAKVSSVTKLDNLKAAILAWDGTADTLTSDVVSAWGSEGTNPTLVSNWTYENTPANLNPTTSYQTFSITANVDTVSAKNIAVFIWSDVTDTTIGDFLYITGVRLVAGSVAKPLVQRPYAQELVLCQRYYEKSFRATQAPATNTGSGGDTYYLSQPIGASAFFYGPPSVPFRVPKRATPTVTLYNIAAANNEIRNYSRSSDCSSSTISTATETGFITSATSAGGSAVGDLLGFGWTASAEL